MTTTSGSSQLRGSARPRMIPSPTSKAVLSGRIVTHGDLSALDTNVVVMQILDAARESARTGRSVRLTKLAE